MGHIPDISVSKQPRLPQWQSTSLSKHGRAWCSPRKARLTRVEFAIEDKSAAIPRLVHENNVFSSLNHAFGFCHIHERVSLSMYTLYPPSRPWCLPRGAHQNWSDQPEPISGFTRPGVISTPMFSMRSFGYIQLFDEVDDISNSSSSPSCELR